MTADRPDTLRLPRWLAILLISLAGLLLEVGYTRIVSYKLWYYYTYLVIGLALLGIGSGGVFVAIFSPFRRWSTDRIIAVTATVGAISIGIGYLIVAVLHVDTVAIWDYWTSDSFSNLARLSLICFVIFASFISFGVIVSVLLGRAGDDVGRIYFSDLVGAGIGCLIAIPLISHLGPPRVVMLAAFVFALVGLASCRVTSLQFGLASAVAVVLVFGTVSSTVLPDVHTEDRKQHAPIAEFRGWGPVFRVDVVLPPGGDGSNMLLLHDGTFGSGIHRFNGDASTLDYSKDPRSLPFETLGSPPPHELIIGSAGGNEILASLAYKAPNIEAVELNPVTTGLLTSNKRFADYTGHLADRPDVHMHQGDGRSYLARSDTKYNLIWYVAPDSYAATNAASSGAFVLSESYLYTHQMIKETLKHLAPDGIMVVQFGELKFETAPNRTSRYVVTARKALEDYGIKDPSQHLLVSAQLSNVGDLSTIIVSKPAITPETADRFLAGVAKLPQQQPFAVPGHTYTGSVVSQLASGSDAQVSSIVDHSPKNITAISDDGPYFWHFSRFRDVISHIGKSLNVSDPEDVIGERVLLLLLGIALFYAGLFLIAPFLFVRKKWAALPAKGTSAVYFAALGLGFMFFEITMIQRLVLFLGYPTYSLTVTLAAILVFTGIGALLSKRFADRAAQTMPILIGVLAVLTAFYLIVVPRLITGPLLSTGLGTRIFFAVLFLAPLGVCLGMFMPLGLGRVVNLTPHGEEYVAWAWAVNGFFSVVGSVLTTILSMAFGFRMVQLAGLIIYAIAAFAFTRLPSPVVRSEVVIGEPMTGEPISV
ncbi:MAG TPA: hypothetical protein VL856_21230 [Acidimicrobiia bacterium]|jgi:hypothetical protein|nr:hypothetical protein [Acidimicrobiia bacterium]